MICWYWVTSPRFTVALAADHGTIVDGPPIVRARWIGRTVVELCSAWRVDGMEFLG